MKGGCTTLVKVNRKDNEDINSLIRRFSQKVRSSGRLGKARDSRYLSEDKSEKEKKEYALWRKKVRKVRDKLLKTGEISRGEKIEPERLRKELRKLNE